MAANAKFSTISPKYCLLGQKTVWSWNMNIVLQGTLNWFCNFQYGLLSIRGYGTARPEDAKSGQLVLPQCVRKVSLSTQGVSQARNIIAVTKKHERLYMADFNIASGPEKMFKMLEN